MANTTKSTFTPFRLVVAGLIVLVISAVGGWYKLVYLSPSNVFNRMLGNVLSTPSVTKTIYQKENGQELNQRTYLETSPQQRAQSVVALHEGANGATVVTTESIGTISADYVRYVDIKTDQKTAAGKNFDFSSVLGIWGKSAADNPASGGAQLYNQTILGVMPIGNLTPAQRQQLLKQIKKDQVYSVDYANVKKAKQNGRLIYSFDASVKPVAYVTMLKAYGHDIGLKQLESVDPSEYASSPPLKFSFEIDALSSQLKTIKYSDSVRTETFTSYGGRQSVAIPDKTVPVEDLQTRLQQIQ